MNKQASAVSLESRIEALRKSHGESIGLDDVSNVVGSLVHGSFHDDELAAVAAELKELLAFVASAKDELMSMQAKSLSKRDIPNAANELDAVIDATENAAGTIMSAADTIGDMAGDMDGEQAMVLQDISTQLYEASSFQDLTGQRITKVSRTLSHLEERLNALADAIGDEYVEPEDDITRDADGVPTDDTDLLHGPQLEGQGNSQEEIDALLASFD